MGTTTTIRGRGCKLCAAENLAWWDHNVQTTTTETQHWRLNLQSNYVANIRGSRRLPCVYSIRPCTVRCVHQLIVKIRHVRQVYGRKIGCPWVTSEPLNDSLNTRLVVTFSTGWSGSSKARATAVKTILPCQQPQAHRSGCTATFEG